MILVTGGAGFIGSHLCEALLGKEEIVVAVADKFGLGEKNERNIAGFREEIKLEKIDLTDLASVTRLFSDYQFSRVFHYAAYPVVKDSAESTVEFFHNNVTATFNVLEGCRKTGVKQVVFPSTSTVYGDVKKIPTPEEYPLEPISNYAASKVAGEAFVSSFAHSYGIKGAVLRYANIFGPRASHGIMWDFYWKLKKNPSELEILGDGNQKKSYLYISDCISASLLAAEKQVKTFEVFNIGSDDSITAKEIADFISQTMDLAPKYVFSGGKRGWVGDVVLMQLDTAKIRSLGWEPKVSIREGIGRYVQWLEKEHGSKVPFPDL